MDYKIDYLDSEFKANFANTRSGKGKERSWKDNRSNAWWKLMGNEAAARL